MAAGCERPSTRFQSVATALLALFLVAVLTALAVTLSSVAPSVRLLASAVVTPIIGLTLLLLYFELRGRSWPYAGAAVLGALGIGLRLTVSTQPHLGSWWRITSGGYGRICCARTPCDDDEPGCLSIRSASPQLSVGQLAAKRVAPPPPVPNPPFQGGPLAVLSNVASSRQRKLARGQPGGAGISSAYWARRTTTRSPRNPGPRHVASHCGLPAPVQWSHLPPTPDDKPRLSRRHRG
jgi:hypothetical protein